MTTVIKIEKLVFGGHGLGRDGGGVVLVPGVAAGETVEFEDDGAKGGTRIGRVINIIDPSPCRREAPCPRFGECGGCDWLFLSYDEQVRRKKDIVIDCVERIGKFHYPHDVEVFTASEFGYRIRAQIKIDWNSNIAGFFRRKTNDVIKVDRCPLLDERLNSVLAALNGGMLGAVNNDNVNAVSSVKILAGEKIASSPVIRGLTHASAEIGVAGIKFLAGGGSFFQSNGFLLEALGRWAHGLLGGGYCLDLYGGTGFFSLMLADDFEEILLVENVAEQVRLAERNFDINKKGHVRAAVADVERGDMDRITGSRRPDCVIIDPPRPGLAKAARKWLTGARPRHVLYVSCNPSTFARDAGALLGGGYKLTKLALFDLYPNTHHIEVAGIFDYV
jgi:23S rRNA (uracil1939-C5)-methyltransferase